MCFKIKVKSFLFYLLFFGLSLTLQVPTNATTHLPTCPRQVTIYSW